MSSNSGGGAKEKGPRIATPLVAPPLVQNSMPTHASDGPTTDLRLAQQSWPGHVILRPCTSWPPHVSLSQPLNPYHGAAILHG